MKFSSSVLNNCQTYSKCLSTYFKHTLGNLNGMKNKFSLSWNVPVTLKSNVFKGASMRNIVHSGNRFKQLTRCVCFILHAHRALTYSNATERNNKNAVSWDEVSNTQNLIMHKKSISVFSAIHKVIVLLYFTVKIFHDFK